jgi:hypothetical protein
MKVHTVAKYIAWWVRVENRAGIASSQSSVSVSPLKSLVVSKIGCKYIWGIRHNVAAA